MKSRFVSILVTLLVVLFSASSARGNSTRGSVVRVLASACERESFDAARLVDLLRVELAQQGVAIKSGVPGAGEAALEPEDLALVTVAPQSCEGTAKEVRLEVFDQVTQKRLERRMLVSDLEPSERPRALAIAVAELLQAAWAESILSTSGQQAVLLPEAARAAILRRMAQPPSATSNRERTPGTGATARENDANDRLSIGIGAATRSFPSSGLGWLGGDLSAGYALTQLVVVQGGLEAGRIEGSTPTIGASGAVLNVSGDALLGHVSILLRSSGHVQVALGPRFSAGYSRLASLWRDESGPVALLGLAGELRASLSPHWQLTVGADAGYVLGGVSLDVGNSFGDDRPTLTVGTGIESVTTGLRLGLAWTGFGEQPGGTNESEQLRQSRSRWR